MSNNTTQRPNLLGANSPAPAASMLQGLQQPASADGTLQAEVSADRGGVTKPVGAALLVLALAVAGWWAWSRSGDDTGAQREMALAKAQMPDAKVERPSLVAAPVAQADAAASNGATGASAASAVEGAAVAVVETVAAPTPSAASAAAPETIVAAARPTETVKEANRAQRAPTSTRTAAAKRDADKRQAQRKLVAARPAPTKVASVAAPAPGTETLKMRGGSTTTAAVTAARNGDADVDLLSALVAHVDGQGRPINRSPETIAELVRRCEAQIDKTEAQACRRRICTGYWGKAQACPARLANAG